MRWMSPSEILIFYDKILQRFPDMQDMPDIGRAEVIIYYVQNLAHYKCA